MKRSIFVILIIIILIAVVFSGCQENKSTTVTTENVFLESDIIEFANVSLEKIRNKTGIVDMITVSWLFHNIAGRTISADIIVEFYDITDVLVYSDFRQIVNMPADYTEQYMSPTANRVSYDGERVSYVDYVIIHVTET